MSSSTKTNKMQYKADNLKTIETMVKTCHHRQKN